MNALLVPGQGHNFSELTQVDSEEKEQYYALVESLSRQRIDKNSITDHSVNSLCVIANAFANHDRFKKYGGHIDAVAGYSVGQYAALGISGVLSKEDCFYIVKKRSDLMKRENYPETGMLAVLGGSVDYLNEKIQEVCSNVKVSNSSFLEITNFNTVGNYTVAGSLELLRVLERKLQEENKIKKTERIPVEGAWHSRMFRRCEEEMRSLLNGFKFKAPSCLYFDNFTGGSEKDPDVIKENLVRHLFSAVQWERTMESFLEAGVKNCIVIGPGRQIQVMIMYKTRDVKIFEINTLNGLHRCVDLLG